MVVVLTKIVGGRLVTVVTRRHGGGTAAWLAI